MICVTRQPLNYNHMFYANPPDSLKTHLGDLMAGVVRDSLLLGEFPVFKATLIGVGGIESSLSSLSRVEKPVLMPQQ